MEKNLSDGILYGWWALNMTKILPDKELDTNKSNAVSELISEIKEELQTGIPYALTYLHHHETAMNAFGPFEKERHAEIMAPTDPDEDGKDVMGEIWLITKIATRTNDYVLPNHDALMKIWKCPENHEQHHRGCCGICKQQGKELVEMTQIRRWGGNV